MRHAFLVMALLSSLYASLVGARDDADTLWAQVVELGQPQSYPVMDETARRDWTMRKLKYRSMGLDFWNRFPEDPRRYQWFLETGALYLAYPEEHDLASWNRLYEQELKPAFLAWAPGRATHLQQQYFFYVEINRRHGLYRNEKYLVSRQVDLAALQDMVIDFILRYPLELALADGGERFAKQFASLLQQNPGLSDSAVEQRLSEALQKTPSDDLKALGAGIEHVRRLLAREMPVDLKIADLDGGVIDLERLRGKVVLIDFWGVNCDSCFRDMPHIRKLYEELRPRGLEVFGIAVHHETRLEEVRARIKKMDIPGPQCVQDHLPVGSLYRRFGFPSLGYKLLIDRDGYLIASDTDISRIESRLRQLLP